MTIENFLHWNLFEESKESTIFDGSLHLKMPILKLNYDIMDGLKSGRYYKNNNTMKVALTILTSEMMKQSIVANFYLFHFARIDIYEVSRIEGEK